MHLRKWKRNLTLLIVVTMISGASLPVMAKMVYRDIDAGKGERLQGQILVPYVESDISNIRALDDLAYETGITRFNIGFIISDREGNPIWVDDEGDEVNAEDIADEIKALRKNDIDVVISFGGKEDRVLHHEIESVRELTDAYEAVIKAYDVKVADFYMDGKGLSKEADAKRNIDALVKLKEAHRDLEIWLTFPADENGLDEEAISIIKYAAERKLDFEGINLMTYTYNTKVKDAKTMADKTIGVIEEAYNDLDDVLKGYSTKELWAALGVTPLIGDQGGNLEFTTEDAEDLADYVLDKGMGYLGFYDTSRDTRSYKYANAFANVLVDTEAPTIPKDLETLLVRADQVAFKWQASTDNHEVAGYQVYRTDENGKEKTFKVEANKFIDTDVEARMQYEYIVRAFDKVGNESRASKVLKVETPRKTDDTVKVDPIKNEDITETSVNLSWKEVKDADYYRIYRDGIVIVETKKTKYEDTRLEKGKTYTYLIEAVDEYRSEKDVIAASKSFTVTTKGSGKEDNNNQIIEYTGSWKPGHTYKAGDIVTFNDKQYVCISGHTAMGDWYPNTTLALWNTVPTKITDDDDDEYDDRYDRDDDEDDDEDDNDLDANLTVWEVGVKYQAEDVVLYKGKYYSCIKAHTAHVQNWNPASEKSLWGLYDYEDDED